MGKSESETKPVRMKKAAPTRSLSDYSGYLVGVAIVVVALLFSGGDERFERPSTASNAENESDERIPAPIRHGWHQGGRAFTLEELAPFNGRDRPEVYLAIAGRVYDVTKGKKYYSKAENDGGYSGFSGTDATRSFVSGDFSPEGLVSDISGLPHDQLKGILEWIEFYDHHEDYKYVGYVSDGPYYFPDGTPRESLLDDAHKPDPNAAPYPRCNASWSQKDGRKLWCTTKSGGTQRDWVGVPRQFVTQARDQDGKLKTQCVCIPSVEVMKTDGRLREYEGCPSNADSCWFPE